MLWLFHIYSTFTDKRLFRLTYIRIVQLLCNELPKIQKKNTKKKIVMVCSALTHSSDFSSFFCTQDIKKNAVDCVFLNRKIKTIFDSTQNEAQFGCTNSSSFHLLNERKQ